MLPAAKNPFVLQWFRGYTRSYLQRSFHRVLATGAPPALPDGPLLVCLNHTSWWDMLLAFWLAHDVLDSDGYGPMDERQLRRYSVLRRIGVFGVDRESLRGGREFLEYGQSLMREQRRSLWITAQGEMVSTRLRPVRFYSGIARLAQAVGPCHITTVALDYEFWDEKRPEVLVSFGPVMPVETGDRFSRRELLETLQQRMERQLDELQELKASRDASRLQLLLSGRTGISPAYDSLRKVAGLALGRRSPAEHGAVATPPRWGPARRTR